MIEIFVYDKNTGLLEYSDFGGVGVVISSIPDGYDFTLTRPPSVYEPYKWNGKEWVKVETET